MLLDKHSATVVPTHTLGALNIPKPFLLSAVLWLAYACCQSWVYRANRTGVCWDNY